MWFGAAFVADIVVTAMYLLFAIMNNTEIALIMFPALAETDAPDTCESLIDDIFVEFPDTNRTTSQILKSLSSTLNTNAT